MNPAAVRRARGVLLALTLGFGAGAAHETAQRGLAVWYGGRADRETKMTAAHLTLPFGTWVKVTHERTGREVTVKINDRGPHDDPRRIIDLSRPAAEKLGIVREGVAPVRVEVVKAP